MPGDGVGIAVGEVTQISQADYESTPSYRDGDDLQNPRVIDPDSNQCFTLRTDPTKKIKVSAPAGNPYFGGETTAVKKLDGMEVCILLKDPKMINSNNAGSKVAIQVK